MSSNIVTSQRKSNHSECEEADGVVRVVAINDENDTMVHDVPLTKIGQHRELRARARSNQGNRKKNKRLIIKD